MASGLVFRGKTRKCKVPMVFVSLEHHWDAPRTKFRL